MGAMGVGDERTWTITELADEFGVTLRTIRFYEEQGLLNPARNGTRRIFDDGDRVRLGLVLRGKRLGFGLDEIKKIIGMYDAAPARSASCSTCSNRSTYAAPNWSCAAATSTPPWPSSTTSNAGAAPTWPGSAPVHSEASGPTTAGLGTMRSA